MAESFEVTGMIISSMPVGEYDRRIVILTKECGKIAAFAKGARRPNSQLVGVTRAFIFGRFEVYRSRDSYTIYKAYADNYFEEVVTDLDGILYACYFAELADYYGRENLDASEIINLLYISLKALTKEHIPNELVRYIYELRLIAINGECPDVFVCHECGADNINAYSLLENAFLCEECSQKTTGTIRLSQTCVYTIQYIITSPLKKLFSFTVDENVLSVIRRVMNRITKITFDKDFKSKNMLPD